MPNPRVGPRGERRDPRRAAPGPRTAAPRAKPSGAARLARFVAGIPAALWVILALALGLRLWHLGEGLPEFFEEAFPFRRAFEMAGWESGRVDWNPRAFHYPSLTFYLHMVVQWIHFGLGLLVGYFQRPADFYVAYQVDPTPMAVLARLVGVAADLAVLLAVARIGERLRRGAGLLAALLVALSATSIHGAHAIYTDPVMSAFAVWALERMMAYRADGRSRTLAAAVILSGLAAGAKYPALLLALPLAWAVLARQPGRAGARPLALALLGGAAVFMATSPFLIADLAKTRFDLMRIASVVEEGQLGTFGRPSASYYLGAFARDFGWAALAFLPASLWWVRRRTATSPTIAGPWLFLLAFVVPVLAGRVEFERYLVPVIPAAALLLAVTALELPELWPRLAGATREAARALAVLAVVAPAGWAGFHAAALGADTTQGQARRFLEARVSADELLVQEAHAAPVLDRWDAEQVARSPAFQAAGPSWRERFGRLTVRRSLRLPLLVAGRASVVASEPGGARREIELFPSSADLNRVFYEPALYRGVDWMVTSDAVRGRYQADPARFAAQLRLYRLLDHSAERVATFRSGGSVTGPEILVYRITGRTRAALGAGGTLDSLWWTRDIPAGARVQLAEVVKGMGEGAVPPGMPPWVAGLAALFERQVEPFVYRLALELADLGRCGDAIPLAGAILTMAPAHLQATGIVATCAEAGGDPARARDAIGRLLAARDPQERGLADVRLEYARLLAQTGARDEARRQLTTLSSAAWASGDVQRRAREMMQALEREPRP